jgi:hypothetical protein
MSDGPTFKVGDKVKFIPGKNTNRSKAFLSGRNGRINSVSRGKRSFSGASNIYDKPYSAYEYYYYIDEIAQCWLFLESELKFPDQNLKCRKIIWHQNLK